MVIVVGIFTICLVAFAYAAERAPLVDSLADDR